MNAMTAEAAGPRTGAAGPAGMPPPAPEAARQNAGNPVTGKRGKHALSDDDHLRLVRWHIKALARRMNESPWTDTSALATLAGMRAELDAAIDEVAVELAARGFNWSEIARDAGLTRQGANKKWSKR